MYGLCITHCTDKQEKKNKLNNVENIWTNKSKSLHHCKTNLSWRDMLCLSLFPWEVCVLGCLLTNLCFSLQSGKFKPNFSSNCPCPSHHFFSVFFYYLKKVNLKNLKLLLCIKLFFRLSFTLSSWTGGMTFCSQQRSNIRLYQCR